MRSQVTYLAEDITNNLVTTGSQWMTEDRQEYIGQYHSYATGEVYTRATWDALLSKKLIPYEAETTVETIYKRLKPNIKTKYQSPTNYIPIVTTEDISKGMFTRYFLQNQVSYTFIEVDKPQFEQWQKKTIDPILWKGVSMQWKITGNVDDTMINNAIDLGIVSFNKNSILQANKVTPGIDMLLTNYLQFATDGEYIVPKDINS
jgi:hypothetical protein